jgi:hypothetical protein
MGTSRKTNRRRAGREEAESKAMNTRGGIVSDRRVASKGGIKLHNSGGQWRVIQTLGASGDVIRIKTSRSTTAGHKGVDRESAEIMNDPDLMSELQQAESDLKAGRMISGRDLRKSRKSR